MLCRKLLHVMCVISINFTYYVGTNLTDVDPIAVDLLVLMSSEKGDE